MQSSQVGLDSGVLVELALDVVVDVDQLLHTAISRTPKFKYTSGISPTFCRVSINSAMGRSDRYLTLFQLNVRRYWSVGSVRDLADDVLYTKVHISGHKLTIVDHLVLRNLILVAFQDSLQRVCHSLDNTLATGMKLR